MIMKKAISFCKGRGIYEIIDDEIGDIQWIGNGEAYYPLEGFPIFDEDSFCASYDISDKKREKIVVKRHMGFGILGGGTPYDVKQEDEYRPMMDASAPSSMMALTNGENVLFVLSDYMTPIETGLL